MVEIHLEKIRNKTLTMKNGFIVTDAEIVKEASKDSTYCQLSVDMGHWGAIKQLEKVRDWAVEKRCELELKRENHKLIRPKEITGTIILGAKIKAIQQIIDKCVSGIAEINSDNEE